MLTMLMMHLAWNLQAGCSLNVFLSYEDGTTRTKMVALEPGSGALRIVPRAPCSHIGSNFDRACLWADSRTHLGAPGLPNVDSPGHLGAQLVRIDYKGANKICRLFSSASSCYVRGR